MVKSFSKKTKDKKKIVIHHENAKSFQVAKKKVFFEKNQSFFRELVKLYAYIGDPLTRSYINQNNFFFASRNEYQLLNLHEGIFQFKRALHFLQRQEKKSLVFVGCPKDAKDNCLSLFQDLNVTFFPSSDWLPGYISKKGMTSPKILILYDVHTNAEAQTEAFRANWPIVGFVTSQANGRGVDYPIALNFESAGMAYYHFWKSFFAQNKQN